MEKYSTFPQIMPNHVVCNEWHLSLGKELEQRERKGDRHFYSTYFYIE